MNFQVSPKVLQKISCNPHDGYCGRLFPEKKLNSQKNNKCKFQFFCDFFHFFAFINLVQSKCCQILISANSRQRIFMHLSVNNMSMLITALSLFLSFTCNWLKFKFGSNLDLNFSQLVQSIGSFTLQ
jgi:hypothetical protein